MTSAHEISGERTNILLVDDQPGKLASYEVVLSDLRQNLLKATSAKEALELLLKHEIAVLLVDVCMPELDGFELAQMIREHPRYKDIAIIFISAVAMSEQDWLRAYDLGAVDYVSVPVVPEILRAKVQVFLDLHRKTKQLARINDELEMRVQARTAELKRAIAHQELLAREVDHRARNALAVLQSIVSLMPPLPSPLFGKALQGRIQAMGRAHTLLSEHRWEGADLAKLMKEELDAFSGSNQIHVEGPPIAVRPEVAQGFALAIHELATNAAKYGALSVPGGQLNVTWKMQDGQFDLHWVENGGPSCAVPQKKGFGSKVISAGVESQLRGKISRKWSASGLEVRVTAPAAHFTAPAESKPLKGGVTIEDVVPASFSLMGNVILIVEDEPLVASMMAEALVDMGAACVGPFTSLAEALDADLSVPHAAVLDVNVGGELVYPLAERLMRRDLPFVFVSGYDAGAIDRRFAHAPVLTKPVDPGELGMIFSRLLSAANAQGGTSQAFLRDSH